MSTGEHEAGTGRAQDAVLAVTQLLRGVLDPELGVNIVDLGLVYDVTVEHGVVLVTMTMTAPGCPLGGYLEDAITASVGALDWVSDVRVQIVWDPPWGPERMSPLARFQLGWRA